MFTGLIEAMGTVETPPARLSLVAPFARELAPGDSVAVDGVCLTVATREGETVAFDVSAETLRRTTLGALRAGERVNLERPLAVGARLGGHIVLGHVDGTAKVVSTSDEGTPMGPQCAGGARNVWLELPAGLERYVVEKGSIAVDGVSLTVNEVTGARVRLTLIPETLARTALASKGVGRSVNVEVDILAKHVERLLAGARR